MHPSLSPGRGEWQKASIDNLLQAELKPSKHLILSIAQSALVPPKNFPDTFSKTGANFR